MPIRSKVKKKNSSSSTSADPFDDISAVTVVKQSVDEAEVLSSRFPFHAASLSAHPSSGIIEEKSSDSPVVKNHTLSRTSNIASPSRILTDHNSLITTLSSDQHRTYELSHRGRGLDALSNAVSNALFLSPCEMTGADVITGAMVNVTSGSTKRTTRGTTESSSGESATFHHNTSTTSRSPDLERTYHTSSSVASYRISNNDVNGVNEIDVEESVSDGSETIEILSNECLAQNRSLDLLHVHVPRSPISSSFAEIGTDDTRERIEAERVFWDTAWTGVLMFVWFSGSLIKSLSNKAALNRLPRPMTLLLTQLLLQASVTLFAQFLARSCFGVDLKRWYYRSKMEQDDREAAQLARDLGLTLATHSSSSSSLALFEESDEDSDGERYASLPRHSRNLQGTRVSSGRSSLSPFQASGELATQAELTRLRTLDLSTPHQHRSNRPNRPNQGTIQANVMATNTSDEGEYEGEGFSSDASSSSKSSKNNAKTKERQGKKSSRQKRPHATEEASQGLLGEKMPDSTSTENGINAGDSDVRIDANSHTISIPNRDFGSSEPSPAMSPSSISSTHRSFTRINVDVRTVVPPLPAYEYSGIYRHPVMTSPGAESVPSTSTSVMVNSRSSTNVPIAPRWIITRSLPSWVLGDDVGQSPNLTNDRLNEQMLDNRQEHRQRYDPDHEAENHENVSYNGHDGNENRQEIPTLLTVDTNLDIDAVDALSYHVTIWNGQYYRRNWRGRLLRKLDRWAPRLLSILPFTFLHLNAHVLTQFSMVLLPLWAVKVVKSLSPVFGVFLARAALGEPLSGPILASLLPIAAGVGLVGYYSKSTTGETHGHDHVSSYGLLLCAGGAALFVAEKVTAKGLFQRNLSDPFSLLVRSNYFAAVLLLPLWVHRDGFEPLLQGLRNFEVSMLWLLNGSIDSLLGMAMLLVLTKISATAHQVANAGDRLFVLLVSVFVFNNILKDMQIVGIGLSLVGMVCYNIAKHRQAMQSKAEMKEKQGLLRRVPDGNESERESEEVALRTGVLVGAVGGTSMKGLSCESRPFGGVDELDIEPDVDYSKSIEEETELENMVGMMGHHHNRDNDLPRREY